MLEAVESMFCEKCLLKSLISSTHIYFDNCCRGRGRARMRGRGRSQSQKIAAESIDSGNDKVQSSTIGPSLHNVNEEEGPVLVYSVPSLSPLKPAPLPDNHSSTVLSGGGGVAPSTPPFL